MTQRTGLPLVDTCYVSRDPEQCYVMAREAHEPLASSRRFPIVQMIDEDGDDTTDPTEATVVVFGAPGFGFCTYVLTDSGPATTH